MTNAKSSLILLLGLAYTLSQWHVSDEGLDNHSRQEDANKTTADGDHRQIPKENWQTSNDNATLNNGMEDLNTSPESAMKFTATKKDREKVKRNGNTQSIYANENSQAKGKESTKPPFPSLASNLMDINDVFQAGSRTDKLLTSYRDNFKDCFCCLPCDCYFTFSHNIVAFCRSPIDQINAVLPNDTKQLTISNSPMRVFDATYFVQYHSLTHLTVSKNKNMSTMANSSDSSHVLAVTKLHLDSNSINDIMITISNKNMEFPPETETSDEITQNFWDQLSKEIGHSVVKDLQSSSASADD